MKNRIHRLSVLLSLFLASLMILASCGGAGGAKEIREDYYAPEQTPGISYNDGAGSYRKDQESGVYPDEKDGSESGDDVSQSIIINTTTEKLVYTCQITLETTTFQKTAEAVRELISTYGGFIQEDTVSDNDNNWYYSEYTKTGASLSEYIVIRVPTENYTAFLKDLDGQGKIRSKQQQVQNITRAYNDTEITIESLKTQEKRLLEMLEQADTIEDMIYVEQRLSEVQNELKIQTSRLSSMDTDVAYSTITISIKEVLEYSKDVDPVKTSTFGDRLKNTLKYSWQNFLVFLEDMLFFLIKALPILLVLGVIAVIIVLVARKLTKTSSNKKKDAVSSKDSFIVQKKEEPEKEE